MGPALTGTYTQNCVYPSRPQTVTSGFAALTEGKSVETLDVNYEDTVRASIPEGASQVWVGTLPSRSKMMNTAKIMLLELGIFTY